MTSTKQWNPDERVRELSYRMVRWPSETGTADEAAFAPKLAELLRELPYFKANPGDIAVIDSHGSPVTKNIVAVVRGTGRRTLALAGHYDVVETSNYRDLKYLAFEPDALLEALLADLTSRPLAAHEEKALADFQSGDYLPGRGMLDMKSGVAAGIATLEHFAEQADREGNLVLFVTPDEERGSRGMRSLRDALPELMEKWGLDIIAGINLDATSDQGDGSEGRAIYRGTIGKQLPFAFIVGQSSHASYPFEGISAHRIAAEIMRAVEANMILCDRGEGNVSPPPICLEARDFRGGYEVTTPERTWVAFNWLTHSLSPEALFTRFGEIVGEALEEAIAQFNANAQSYAQLTGEKHSSGHKGRVMTVAQLRETVHRIGGEEALQRIEALEAELSKSDNPLLISRELVDHMVAEARVTGPLVIVGFGSLVYPHVNMGNETALERGFSTALEDARKDIERRLDTTIKYREIFAGISDMSFFGHVPDAKDSEIIADNTPAAQFIDKANSKALSYPVVNIGPWGREYHQRLERVYTPYAFGVLPQFLDEIAKRLLRK
ncbi:M20/M25/M40 family metallo-hydrolase [Falsochrobactrum sp. TDYN1]|uniref:M20/M25/M40 family metallo-hydrolase n=1 Tax=Falsochrobactrum tianjinense TaxID=2706015 RepID=A0A949UT71_9HYPH|nr:M20/M25/M40 family metallo-hydrolase [Falsochrobactrum sp. TDYN1]MBV2143520.1 M20/M25/M40 family metallo-hydrolase [Falsochrobactrum sp. TDYN1]